MKHDLKLRDLRSLQELLDDLEWETELIGEETDYPSLAAVLPVEEDCDERAVFTYIDLPDEDSEFTKYLQIYLQIPLKIDRIPAGELIVFVNQLNMLTLIGSFSYAEGLLASRIEGTPTEVIMAAVGHELEAGWR